MFEAIADAVQTINPGESAIFTVTTIPCRRNFVMHENGTGTFQLSSRSTVNQCNVCPCMRNNEISYFVDFGANIAVPTGETVGAIDVALALEGAAVPATTMEVTPAAVEQFFNISVAKSVGVWKQSCCQTLTVKNISTIPILMKNANIVINRPEGQ